MDLDPVTTNPRLYRVFMENDRVRVLEYRDQPGDRTTPHRSVDRQIEAGTTSWLPAQEHSGENIGETETHVIFVELKGGRMLDAEASATALGPSES